jgi:hypothetical protein
MTRHRQRGVVMFIALIVMVALSLAAIALVRSVDTTNAIVGNLSFRMASILPANLGVEKAAAALFQDADIGNAVRIADRNADLPGENYYASRQPGEDSRGIPRVLQKKSLYPFTPLSANDSTTGQATEIRYVIERMCDSLPPVNPPPGTWFIGHCELLPPKFNAGGTENEEKFGFDGTPYYRVTIRVDGPQNTASFLQATLK